MVLEATLEFLINVPIWYTFSTEKMNGLIKTLWSNSKVLVNKQQALFEKLWEMAIPLSARNKELEYHDKTEY